MLENILRKRKPLQSIPPVVRPLYLTILEFYGWSDLTHYLLSPFHFTEIQNETKTTCILPKATAEKCKESLYYPLVVLCLSTTILAPQQSPSGSRKIFLLMGLPNQMPFLPSGLVWPHQSHLEKNHDNERDTVSQQDQECPRHLKQRSFLQRQSQDNKSTLK